MFQDELQPLITALASGDTAAAKDEEIKILRRLLDDALTPGEDSIELRECVETLDMVLGR